MCGSVNGFVDFKCGIVGRKDKLLICCILSTTDECLLFCTIIIYCALMVNKSIYFMKRNYIYLFTVTAFPPISSGALQSTLPLYSTHYRRNDS